MNFNFLLSCPCYLAILIFIGFGIPLLMTFYHRSLLLFRRDFVRSLTKNTNQTVVFCSSTKFVYCFLSNPSFEFLLLSWLLTDTGVHQQSVNLLYCDNHTATLIAHTHVYGHRDFYCIIKIINFNNNKYEKFSILGKRNNFFY